MSRKKKRRNYSNFATVDPWDEWAKPSDVPSSTGQERSSSFATPRSSAYVPKAREKEPLPMSMGTIQFSLYAWAKYQYYCEKMDTEIGLMGSTPIDRPLFVEDVHVLDQVAASAHCEMTAEGIANFFDEMIDKGYQPSQFGRIWLHTHPQMSATPSHTDETTFQEVFGKCDHAVMGIISKTGDAYFRLRIGRPLLATQILKPVIDWSEMARMGTTTLLKNSFLSQEVLFDWDTESQKCRPRSFSTYGPIAGFGAGVYRGYYGSSYSSPTVTQGEGGFLPEPKEVQNEGASPGETTAESRTGRRTPDNGFGALDHLIPSHYRDRPLIPIQQENRTIVHYHPTTAEKNEDDGVGSELDYVPRSQRGADRSLVPADIAEALAPPESAASLS